MSFYVNILANTYNGGSPVVGGYYQNGEQIHIFGNKEFDTSLSYHARTGCRPKLAANCRPRWAGNLVAMSPMYGMARVDQGRSSGSKAGQPTCVRTCRLMVKASKAFGQIVMIPGDLSTGKDYPRGFIWTRAILTIKFRHWKSLDYYRGSFDISHQAFYNRQ